MDAKMTDSSKQPEYPNTKSGASKPKFGSVTIRNRGRVPHWEADAAIYFVTFRLNDSLPEHAMVEIKSERAALLAKSSRSGGKLSVQDKKRLFALFTERVEGYLDAGAGACSLKNKEVALCVKNAIFFFHNKRYRLFVWCIMPNHVHVVIRPLPEFALADILHSWKSFTSKVANKILKASGTFWQKEYYDHLVRDEDDFNRIVKYVLENPIKAGLKNWPWVGIAS
jgi:REP element-mobilizing transposase RayT